jgi:hypothetical protein
MIYASLWHGARVPAQSTNGFSPKKQPTAARYGYRIVRIRLLDGACILSRFLKNDKFCLCDRHALRFEQQVGEIFLAAAPSKGF